MEEVFLIGVALVLTGAVFAALAQIQVRRLVQHEHPAAIAFYFAATSTILSLFASNGLYECNSSIKIVSKNGNEEIEIDYYSINTTLKC